jgi:glycerophosphoryl diester phosphodiesterase
VALEGELGDVHLRGSLFVGNESKPMKSLVRSFTLLAALAIAAYGLALTSVLSAPAQAQSRRIQIYGHRGARGLAPENSLPAYKVALALGVDFVDADVVVTRDGEVLICHDPVLSPSLVRGPDGNFVKPGEFVVKDLTLQELHNFDVGTLNPELPYAKVFPDQRSVPGTRMPTLRELIRYTRSVAGDSVGFLVEIKNNPARPELTLPPAALAAAVARVLEEEDVVERTEVQAFDFAILYAIQAMNPRIATQYLTEIDSHQQMTNPDPRIAGLWTGGVLLKDYDNSIPRMISSLGGRVWGSQDTEMTAAALQEAHALGLKVVIWNWPDDPNDTIPADGKTGSLAKLLDLGVDGVIHDRPDVVRGLLAARGLPLPRPFPLQDPDTSRPAPGRSE